MKVLYVLRYFPTLTETFVYREIAGLRARGVDVGVAAIGTRADGVLQDEAPAGVVMAPRGLSTAKVLPGLIAGWSTREGRSAWTWLNRHLRPKDAARALWLATQCRGTDRLHVHFAGEAAEWARGAARVAGIPYSVTVHAADLVKPRPSLADVLADARPVITVSRWSADLLKARYGVDACLVRCGVDPARYRPATPDRPGALRVIAVGRGVPKKGLDLLAEAMRGLDADLHLVSDAAIAGPRVTAGPLAPSRVADALAAAHLFALPCRRASDGDQDNVPVAMIEAMAAGLPVLTTPVGGIPELVDEEVGWLVPSDDVAALRSAIVAIAADPRERARRGAAARQRVGTWTVDAQVDALLDAWGAR